MKKVTIAAIIIGAFILYSLLYTRASSITLSPNSINDSRSSSSSATSATPASSGTPQTTTGTSSGQYKDGSYVGSVADAQWGNIQVKAIIKGGKITDVQFLQYPNERNRSVFINQNADPQLTSEAIQVQNANVDIVTGATDSSQAFIQSLSDALTQAKA